LQMRLLDTLNNVVITAGGRLYPAKDAQMSSDFFQKSYTNWSEFDKHRDPVLMSKFWTRVTA
jgi:hypothetical protein